MNIAMTTCRFNVGDLVRMKDPESYPHGTCVVVHVACEDNRRAYRVRAPGGNHWLCHEDTLELVSRTEWDSEAI